MKKHTASEGKTVVELNSDEILALCNSMNETLEALDDDEFQTRMGFERNFVVGLLDEFSKLAVGSAERAHEPTNGVDRANPFGK
jgi:hypothetical protein